MSDEEPLDGDDVELTSDYVRGRECVRIVGRFERIFDLLELHLLQNDVKLEKLHEALLRETIVACTLHHANRPRNELTGWTINLVEPRINIFSTADSEAGTVCGRVFTKNVKESEQARLHAHASRPHFPRRESIVDVEGLDPLLWAEAFYRKSEQLPARFFRLGDDGYGLVMAQHGYDAPWLEALSPEDLLAIPKNEELGPLERRRYRFGCGCDATIIRRIIKEAATGDLDGFFEGEERLRVECPRCAAEFFISRKDLEGS